jgi:hypothetical protein
VSAAPILPQAPETVNLSRFSLEQEAKSIGVRYATNTREAKSIWRDLWLNFTAWKSRRPLGTIVTLDAYGDWLDELECGIPRTSLWRKLHAGHALVLGYPEEWSEEQLVDAAQLHEAGNEPDTVRATVESGKAAKAAEATRHAGAFRLPVSVAFQGDAQAAIPILTDYYNVPATDAVGALLSRVVSLKSSGKLADLLGERE